MDSMKALDIANTNVLTVSPNDTLAHVRRLILKHNITKFPVFDGGLLVGAVTEMEVAKAYDITRGPIDNVLVSEVMTDNVIAVSPTDELADVVPELLKRALITVQDKSEFIGIITKTDTIKALLHSLDTNKPVSSVHTVNLKYVRPDQSIFRAVKIMKEENVKHLPVIQGGQLLGIVSAKDIALATFGLRPKKVTFLRYSDTGARRAVRIVPQTVGGIMRTSVETISPKLNLMKAANRLISRSVGSLIVQEAGRPVGIVTKTDVLHTLKKREK